MDNNNRMAEEEDDHNMDVFADMAPPPSRDLDRLLHDSRKIMEDGGIVRPPPITNFRDSPPRDIDELVKKMDSKFGKLYGQKFGKLFGTKKERFKKPRKTDWTGITLIFALMMLVACGFWAYTQYSARKAEQVIVDAEIARVKSQCQLTGKALTGETWKRFGKMIYTCPDGKTVILE